MGSETAREKKIEEKIKDYKELIETAYLLFDGKYTHNEVENMPYKQLIELIQFEEQTSSKELRELKEMKAAHKANKQFQQMR